MGYTTPLWKFVVPCAKPQNEACYDTENRHSVYVLTDLGMDRLPTSLDGEPARQLLLSELATAIWYWGYLRDEFDEAWPRDVFDFAGCPENQ